MIQQLVIPGWRPAALNQYVGRHWAVGHRLKKQDNQTVRLTALLQGLRPATSKRRVSVQVTLGKRQRPRDPDACWKSLLDALVAARLLTDDDAEGVQLGDFTYERGEQMQTRITLEDLL